MGTPHRILIRNGRVVTMDAGLGDFERADVLVEGDRIAAVGPDLAVEDAELVDACGAIVAPGFVDTHRHVWQTQLRTAAADWSLFDYVARMRMVYSAMYEPEDARLGNLVGALEALDAGVTTLVDHSHIMNSPVHADAAATPGRAAHLRARGDGALRPRCPHRRAAGSTRRARRGPAVRPRRGAHR
jgi:5-methylthioadenosine/S-adenosylhomocysteine deaminase